MRRARHDIPWQGQFVLLASIWGASFLFIKVLGEHWAAPWVALGRVALGAMTLIALALWRGERLQFERRLWLHLFVVALVWNTVPFTLFAYGEQHVSSIVAGLWNATTPLWVLVVILAAFGEEHPNRERVAGLAVGFAGVALLLGPWRGLGHGQLLGDLACAAAAVCYGIGFPYTRRYLASRTEGGIALSAGQLVCAVVQLGLVVPFSRAPTVHIGLDGAGSLFALGALGTGVAYALNYSVVRAAGSIVAGAVTYLIPVFSTLLGVVVLGEALSWNQPVGAAVLLSGVAITDRRLIGAVRTWRRIPAPVRSA